MTQPVTVFSEVQHARDSRWLRATVYGTAVLAWVGFVQQVVLRRPFGREPGPDWLMWLIWVLFGIGLPALLHSVRLVVEVWSDRIVIRYVPLTTREIALADVRRCEARMYRPVWDYGGWGIKGWSRRRVSYSVRGDRGAQVELRDGRSVMIGSQRAEELAQAITSRLAEQGSGADHLPR